MSTDAFEKLVQDIDEDLTEDESVPHPPKRTGQLTQKDREKLLQDAEEVSSDDTSDEELQTTERLEAVVKCTSKNAFEFYREQHAHAVFAKTPILYEKLKAAVGQHNVQETQHLVITVIISPPQRSTTDVTYVYLSADDYLSALGSTLKYTTAHFHFELGDPKPSYEIVPSVFTNVKTTFHHSENGDQEYNVNTHGFLMEKNIATPTYTRGPFDMRIRGRPHEPMRLPMDEENVMTISGDAILQGEYIHTGGQLRRYLHVRVISDVNVLSPAQQQDLIALSAEQLFNTSTFPKRTTLVLEVTDTVHHYEVLSTVGVRTVLKQGCNTHVVDSRDFSDRQVDTRDCGPAVQHTPISPAQKRHIEDALDHEDAYHRKRQKQFYAYRGKLDDIEDRVAFSVIEHSGAEPLDSVKRSTADIWREVLMDSLTHDFHGDYNDAIKEAVQHAVDEGLTDQVDADLDDYLVQQQKQAIARLKARLHNKDKFDLVAADKVVLQQAKNLLHMYENATEMGVTVPSAEFTIKTIKRKAKELRQNIHDLEIVHQGEAQVIKAFRKRLRNAVEE